MARWAIAFSVLGLASVAHAGGNDFRLNATSNGQGIFFAQNGSSFVANQANWESMVTELGFAIAPRMASPAETLGHAGFATSLLWSGTFVQSGQTFWKGTTSAQLPGGPNGVLQTLQLDVRKGLPMSFEVGIDFTWLVDSEMFSPGLDVRWALVEGFKYAPDVAVRGSVSHLLGQRDINFTVIGVDAVISKGFGVAGMAHIAPYLSWSLIMFSASSRVIDPTPAIEDDVANNLVMPSVSPGDGLHQKITFGTRFLFYVLNLSFQGEMEFLGDSRDGTNSSQVFGPIFTLTTKLGLEY